VRRLLLASIVLLPTTGLGVASWWRSSDVGPAQRGARLAAELGCLGCHGPGGRLADPEGTLGVGTVPSFDHDDVTSYAKSEAEIREWIRDGRPRRLTEEEGYERDPVLRMPAWGDRLSPQELDQLVAYVRAVSDFDAVPEPAASGRDAAARLGCFTCHGPQGRFDTPNPGSLKGHIPSWTGRDFAELARDDGEIREWIREGSPRRLRDNPVAAFFLRRQAIRMPAFGSRVSDADMERIVGYIRWLRSSGTAHEVRAGTDEE
jgi:mono/diheme cytochrome c family protein